jgi:putative hydrolase of the HAD superfamily
MDQELDAAIFDFGGVLTTPIRVSFAAFEKDLGLPEGSLLQAFIDQREGEQPDYFLLEKGQISEGEFYSRMMAKLREKTGHEMTVDDDPAETRRKLFGSIRRNEEMILAAATIGEHYKTAILTNNVREWTDWREMVDAHVFDLVVDSSEVGLRKPEREIYLLTCEGLGVKPDRAAFIDDIPANVEGAQEVGLHGIRFTSTEEVLDALRPLFPRAFDGKEAAGA